MFPYKQNQAIAIFPTSNIKSELQFYWSPSSSLPCHSSPVHQILPSHWPHRRRRHLYQQYAMEVYRKVQCSGGRARSEPGGTRWRTGGEVKGKQANGLGSQYNSTLPRKVVCPALLPLLLLIRTPRLPVVDWTDAPTDLNGLVLFGERRILVSTRVPSRSARAILHIKNLDPVISKWGLEFYFVLRWRHNKIIDFFCSTKWRRQSLTFCNVCDRLTSVSMERYSREHYGGKGREGSFIGGSEGYAK